MAHNPVNHPARPVYRAIAGCTGLYLTIFGVLGAVRNSGAELFAQDDTRLLGQGTNLGWSFISTALGVIILIAVVVGRNADTRVNTLLAYALMALGLAELAVLRTDANYLNFTVSTCVVVMIAGILLLMAGMYGKVGTDEDAQAWREARLLL